MIPNLQKPEIIWDFKRKIFIKENALSHSLCNELIEFGKNNVIKGVNKYPGVFDISFHSCTLPLENNIHANLQNVWNEVINFFNIDVEFIEPYELKHYTTDDFFGKHVDNYWSLTKDIDRKITMSVQLSNDDEYTAGEFVVLGEKIKLKQGDIICFPSYFPHWVEKITSGNRWSLIGWAWGPYWK